MQLDLALFFSVLFFFFVLFSLIHPAILCLLMAEINPFPLGNHWEVKTTVLLPVLSRPSSCLAVFLCGSMGSRGGFAPWICSRVLLRGYHVCLRSMLPIFFFYLDTLPCRCYCFLNSDVFILQLLFLKIPPIGFICQLYFFPKKLLFLSLYCLLPALKLYFFFFFLLLFVQLSGWSGGVMIFRPPY